ncbi:MAG: outer membrane protein assembly factor BamE [Pontibacterium sp.]
MQKLFVSAVLAFIVAGCAEFPGVYKIDVPQGNVITQEMVDTLKPGMTREQVVFVLGTPMLTDTFHADRWDYVYTNQEGNGNYERQPFRVYFSNELLSRIEGDLKPSN